MATEEELNSTKEALTSIPEITKACHDIVQALIEGDEKVSYGSVLELISPTEYDRARAQVISTCASTIRKLMNVRRTSLSAEAIRATSHLNHVQKCCRMCRSENKKNVAAGKAFCCLAREASDAHSAKGFRFKLNGKGQIVAQR